MASEIVFEGYLQKESRYLSALRNRWVVLKSDRKIYTYKQERVYANPTEIIDLKLCDNAVIVNENTYKFALETNNNKQRIFVSDSKAEMNAWIKYIKSAINEQQSVHTLQTYSKLINMGFNEKSALKASQMFGNDVNKCINFITNEHKSNDSEQKVSNIQRIDSVLKILEYININNNESVDVYDLLCNDYNNNNVMNRFMNDYSEFVENIDVNNIHLQYRNKCNIKNCKSIVREFRNRDICDKSTENMYKLYKIAKAQNQLLFINYWMKYI